jgi:hypothetical protein
MTMHYGAGRVASAQALQVRRPVGETAAALPADPFARRPWLRGRGIQRLSGRPAVFVLASLIVALLASSAAPTPLYAIYQALRRRGNRAGRAGPARPAEERARPAEPRRGACRRPGPGHTIDKSV